ncbi:class I SAM-dependent methyltransferase [Methylobacterium oryzihabitans]|uniref:Class I SAM-dependent methyltransferase n=1 Tax=Methylobacterium oryzihabitans TaxID=2499852 RepID=A0A437NXW9_9HYPH|nr:class I SAM-dependent methyltransferase [Methylobacterium oryzihabitans]RVU14750.1 class I SAM-dependent methyltransferase [Methylobacterium oryzihabitans]
MPEFTSDWTSVHFPTWERLLALANWDRRQVKTVVEVGSFEGRSTLWFMDHALGALGSKVYCVDVWDRDPVLARFSSNVRSHARHEDVFAIKQTSFDGLSALIAAKIEADLIYIDGSHAAPHVLEDLVLAFRLAKIGALVMCDDYLWADPAHGGDDIVGRPKIAIDAFTTIFSRKIAMISGASNGQVYFVKTAE